MSSKRVTVLLFEQSKIEKSPQKALRSFSKRVKNWKCSSKRVTVRLKKNEKLENFLKKRYSAFKKKIKIKKCFQKALRFFWEKWKIKKVLRSFFSKKEKLKNVPWKLYGPSQKK